MRKVTQELSAGRFTISQHDIDHLKITYNGSINKRDCYICVGDFESLLSALLAVKEDSQYVEDHMEEVE